MNGVGRACARFPDGDRLDALADVLATEATPVVAEHIDGCPVCGPALADLQAVLPAVGVALAGLPDVPAPTWLQERLTAALAAEQSGAAARPVSGSAPTPFTEPSAAPIPAPVAGLATVLPLPARRPRSWLPWAGGVAAAAVLVVGGLVLGGRGSSPSTSLATSAAGRLAPGPVVNNTGTNYGRDGKVLAAAVPRLLAATETPKAAAGSTAASAPMTALARLRTPAGLASCLASLTSPDVPGVPLAIDYAAYAGQPALVAVLPSTRTGKVDVFVLGADCSATDAKVLYFTRVTR